MIIFWWSSRSEGDSETTWICGLVNATRLYDTFLEFSWIYSFPRWRFSTLKISRQRDITDLSVATFTNRYIGFDAIIPAIRFTRKGEITILAFTNENFFWHANSARFDLLCP